MNLKKITLKNAGPFRNAEFSFTAPVTYLVGENESGKSTLREWITGLLFGFSRQKTLRSGLIRWGEKEAEITAEILTEGDEQITVRRQIRESKAVCLVESSEGTREIGDAPLPGLGEMDRNLYTGVYSLRVEDLKFPDAAAWTALQHKLLSGEVLSFLRPVSEVSSQWREQALKIWRPDKRGNPQLSETMERREELQRQLEEARRRQDLLARLTQEEESLTSELDQTAAELRRLDHFLREAADKRQLMEQLARYERLCEQAGDLSAYASLPRDLEDRYRELEEDLRSAQIMREESEKENAAAQEAIVSFGEREKEILANGEDIRKLAGARTQFMHDEENLADLEAEASVNSEQLAAFARTVLTDQEGMREKLHSVPMAEVSQNAADYARLTDLCAQSGQTYNELTKECAVSRLPLLGLIPGILMLAAGIVLLVFPQLVPETTRGSIAGGLIAAGLILSALAVGFSLPRKRGQLLSQKAEFESLTQQTEQAREKLQASLCGLSLMPELWENPTDITRQLETLLRRMDTGTSLDRQAESTRTRYELFREETLLLAGMLLDNAPGDPLAACDALTSALETAISKKEAANLTDAHSRTRQERLQRISAQQASAMADMVDFKNTIAGMPGADIRDQMDELSRRRHVADRAQILRDEVYERTGCDLSTLRESLAESEWPWHEDAVRQAEESSYEIRERRERMNKRLGALNEERRMLQDQPLPSDLESEIHVLQEKTEHVTFERDQIAVAFGLLRLGEEAWRQEHQPELIRRAGEYLTLITKGKYTRLYLPDNTNSLWVYHEKSQSYLDPVEKRLSKGTLEQIYLSLRLAMLDQLDPPGMPLPLLLDETMVNWDDKRMEGLRQVIDFIARKRQVLFFTCHGEIAERRGELDQRIDLEEVHEV